MDNDNKRPSAALINREWYTSAAGILSRQDLGFMLVQCIEYVFGIDSGWELGGTADVVFKMVKPALDSDLRKYAERCERNANNAKSQRQRVAASGSESQRVAANTTTTSTTTSTSTQSLSTAETEEREKWLIYGYFWSVGSKAIAQELSAFWAYYESLGWKNNKGAPIVSKIACARMWHRQFETGSVPNGADAWYQSAKYCKIADLNIWHVYAGAERKDDKAIVRLRCKSDFVRQLLEATPALERDLRTCWRVQGIDFEPIG